MDLHNGGVLNGYQQPQDLAGVGNLMGYSIPPNDVSAFANLRLDPRDLQPRFGVPFAPAGPSPFPAGQFSSMNPSPFMGQQDMRTLQQSSPFPVRRASGSTHMMPIQQPGLQQSFIPQSSIPQQVSRVQQEPLGYRRPGPFDVNYPTAQNTVMHQHQQQRTVTPSQASSYSSQPIQSGNISAEHSPWYAASQGLVPDGWSQEHTSLTVANLGQHNQLQEQEAEKQLIQTTEPEPIVDTIIPDPSPQVSPVAVAPPSPIVSTTPSAEARTKVRRKSSAPPITKPATSPVVTPSVPAKPPTPPPAPAEHKLAWNVEDEKAATGVTSLRDIQEAEAKKAEARKTAERERAATRAATAISVTTPAVEPVQTFTTSWGLPTSQAGSRSGGSLAPKESPSSPSPNHVVTPQTPVWTTPAKPTTVKKTMKEIQEEEERRKKLAMKEKESMAAAARRGYADTTTKVGLDYLLFLFVLMSCDRPHLPCQPAVRGQP